MSSERFPDASCPALHQQFGRSVQVTIPLIHVHNPSVLFIRCVCLQKIVENRQLMNNTPWSSIRDGIICHPGSCRDDMRGSAGCRGGTAGCWQVTAPQNSTSRYTPIVINFPLLLMLSILGRSKIRTGGTLDPSGHRDHACLFGERSARRSQDHGIARHAGDSERNWREFCRGGLRFGAFGGGDGIQYVVAAVCEAALVHRHAERDGVARHGGLGSFLSLAAFRGRINYGH